MSRTLWGAAVLLVVGGLLGGGTMAAPPGPSMRVKPGDDPQALMAEARLRSGRALMAAEEAKDCLDGRPGNIPCKKVWVRAMAAAGRCDAVMKDLLAMRTPELWDGELAVSEGLCRMRQGDAAGAVVALGEAIQMREKDPITRFEYALAALRARDYELVEEEAAGLLELRDAEWMYDALTAWVSVETGAASADGDIALARVQPHGQSPSAQAQLSMIECRRWLDLGDPVAADRMAKQGIKITLQQTRLLACRAEAIRRQGFIPDAWELVSRPWNQISDSPALDAVKVRLLVDRGDLPEAREALKGLSVLSDPDAVAAAWYLARAAGQQEQMATLAARYGGFLKAPGRALSTFIPLGAAVVPAGVIPAGVIPAAQATHPAGAVP